MKGQKEPGFQDRAEASARAKKKAVEQIKPMPHEAEVAARAAREAEREAKAEAKRAAARAAKEQGELDDREKARTAEAERAKAVLPARTETEKATPRGRAGNPVDRDLVYDPAADSARLRHG